MKIEIELLRNDTRRMQVEADSLREAIAKAKSEGLVPDGFRIESATELGDDGDDGAGDSQLYMGACEHCDIVLLENDAYVACDDGCRFCATCAAELGEKQHA